jgi:hypothetical protein
MQRNWSKNGGSRTFYYLPQSLITQEYGLHQEVESRLLIRKMGFHSEIMVVAARRFLLREMVITGDLIVPLVVWDCAAMQLRHMQILQRENGAH